MVVLLSSKWFILFYFVNVLFANVCCSQHQQQQQLLLVSFDGVQASKFDEFLQENPNSHFSKFIKDGVRAQYMIPSFPTVTFSNHITLVTGLHPESHGVVGNSFYDPKYDTKIRLIGNKNLYEVQWWNQSDPVWLVAKNQGLTTATMFWVGSDVIPRTADIWLPYDHSYPYSLRIENVVNYIKNFHVDFTSLYFDEPDSTGHKYGVSSVQYKEKLKELDGIFGSLIGKMKREKIYDTTNIIVVSDHGMADVKEIINVSNFVDVKKIDFNKTVFGVVSNIYAQPGEEEALYNSLKQVDHLNTYYKHEVPDEFHFSKNDRIAPIVSISDEGYLISLSPIKGGAHGYSNSVESMRTIFLARGPDFKKSSAQIKPFQNTNVYPLICKLLQIKPNDNNGSADMFHDYLTSTALKVTLNYVLYTFVILLSTIVCY